MVVPAQIWFAVNKFNLTCKGAQFELLAGDGYQNVLTMLNSVPYDFNIANGAGDYITPLLAKFLQIAIKVYDVKRCEWMTYFPNMEPADDPARSERETCMARCVRHRAAPCCLRLASWDRPLGPATWLQLARSWTDQLAGRAFVQADRGRALSRALRHSCPPD